MKYKRLICVQTITDVEVHLDILKSNLEVRKQMRSKLQYYKSYGSLKQLLIPECL